jgi:hypothetical protein
LLIAYNATTFNHWEEGATMVIRILGGVCLVSSLFLSGCGAVDNFQPRALQYNQEAATTKSNTILLNILRAGYRLPLQFTEYTTATGQSFLSGQLSATLPVSAIPANTPRTFTLNPQLTGNAQTQVTVQNLNSQDFYYGLQTPVTQQLMANFMAIGYDPKLVMMLSVSSLKRKSGLIVDQIDNDPNDFRKFAQFYDTIKLMLLAGLSFETTEGATQTVGPPLSEDDAKSLLPHYIKASATAAASGSANSLPTLRQKGSTYQLTKSTSAFRICFSKVALDNASRLLHPGLTVSRTGPFYTLHLELLETGANDKFDMKVLPSHLCGANANATNTRGPLVDWDFDLRSPEAIYNYLGKIFQAQLRDPVSFENAYQLPRDFGERPFFLFKLYNGVHPNAVIFATLGGTYSITPNPDTDKSTEVISILTDLWALQSSAKSFPPTSTISVTTQ